MIVVGSLNPAKVTPAREVFARLFPELEVAGADVASGVRAQPLGFEETRGGALNRARGALAREGASWGVGLEGGVEFDASGTGWLFGVVAVARPERVSVVRSASLELPPVVTARVQAGEELGPVMDELSGVARSNTKMGTIGLLTGGLVVRADVWRQALSLGLAPFLRPELYGPPVGLHS